MKNRKILLFVFLMMIVPKLTLGCFFSPVGQVVPDVKVVEYLTGVEYLIDKLQRNYCIEKCYQKFSSTIKLYQVKMMLDTLASAPPRKYYDDDETQDRIGLHFMNIMMEKATVEEAIEIASWQSDGLIKNQEIFKYFKHHACELSEDDFNTILDNLYDTRLDHPLDSEELTETMVQELSTCK